MTLVIIAAAVLAFFAWYVLRLRARAKAARELVAQGATLVDVRTPEEFALGHIPGALNVPLQQLATSLKRVPKQKPVVVYCRSGARNSVAAALFAREGYATVLDLGPMAAWGSRR